MKKLHVGGDIRWAEADGRAVILDLRSESYFVLDPVATSMWNHTVHCGFRDEILCALKRQYDVDPARLEADLDEFIEHCLEKGFLSEKSPVAGAGARRVKLGGRTFLTLRAWWSLFRTSRLLSKLGFTRCYERYASVPVPERVPGDGAELMESAVAAFAKAENFIQLKRAPRDCMPRSLALFRFLRSVGLPVEHRIGVRQFPFLAHAWVEYRGRVVHDDPSNPRRFATLARIAP